MSTYPKHVCYTPVGYGGSGSGSCSPGVDGEDKHTDALRGIAAHDVDIGEPSRDAVEDK